MLNGTANGTSDNRPPSNNTNQLPMRRESKSSLLNWSGYHAEWIQEFSDKHGLTDTARDDLASLLGSVITRTRKRVTVKVPATTANLGSGFDACGLALDIWNVLTVERSNEFVFEIEGEGAQNLPRDETNLVVVGLEAAFKYNGATPPALRYHCVNKVPFARGLGSSSSAIVSGILAGLAIGNFQLSMDKSEEMLQIAAQIEGHPDNVGPCIYGGFQIGIHSGEQWSSSRVQVPDGLMCVVFVPDHCSETKEARGVLPEKIEQKDAIFNCARVALLIQAFATGDLAGLRHATEDCLHQPYRKGMHPHMAPLVEAAREAGAHGCCLSGAGPSVVAFTSGRMGDVLAQNSAERQERQVALAMLQTGDEMTPPCPGRVFITKPVEVGAHIVAEGSDIHGSVYEDPRILYVQ